MKHLVVGNSAAGLFAVEAIRQQDPHGEICVLTADAHPSYSRCLTTYFLAGDMEESQLFLRTPDALAALRIDLHYSCQVTELDPSRRLIWTASGERFAYDACLIATGASPLTPAIPGSTLPEVFTLRHLEDAQRIKSLISAGQKAVVLGGGLVGLKSAYALRKQGLQVQVVEVSSQLLPQLLNQEAANILQDHLEQNGLNIFLNSQVTAINGRQHVESVEFADGRKLPADLIIIGIGVRPNIEPFRNSGLAIGTGILVNERLETNLPGVYAAGDVAETWDFLYQSQRVNAIWPNATQQGRIAGANMCGQSLSYPGSMRMNSVEFFGLRIVSAGMVNPLDGRTTPTWETDDLVRKGRSGEVTYQRLVWHGDTLKGFALVGNTERSGILTALIQAERPLSQDIRRSIRNGKRSNLILTLPRSKS